MCVASRRLEVLMNRDPRIALSQELEAKQPLLDQLRALAAKDPDFFTVVLEGETNLLELMAALDASVVDDEILVDGAKTALVVRNKKHVVAVYSQRRVSRRIIIRFSRFWCAR
jgi:hypothetical protein